MPRGLGLSDRLLLAALVAALVALAAAAQAATLHPNLTDDAFYVGTDCGRDVPNQGNCTLAAAIVYALPGDTVSLEPPSPPGPYTLTLGELLVNKDITIRGAGARSTTITAAGCTPPCRVFQVAQAKVTISRLTITGGKATGPCGGMGPCPDGGGVSVRGASVSNRNAALTLSQCTVSGNTATGTGGTGGFGGGIEVAAATLTVIDSTITGNQATCVGSCGANGGGILATFATVSISNSTVAGNVAGDDTHDGSGGAFASQDTVFTIRSTTISGNTAKGGAGSPRGGNIFGSPGSTYDIRDSIVANGIAAAGANCVLLENPTSPSSITSSGYNIDSLDECGFHAAGDHPATDPQLVSLADNGGETDTEALAAGSPAIDMGSPACQPPSADQRGVARPQPAGGRCDIGSFELVQPSTTTTTTLPPPAEVCGDCIDNDGDGLTDLEDPACCAAAATVKLRASRLAPGRGGAKLTLRGALALTLGAGAHATDDLFVQLRADGRPDFLCARIPAANLVRRGARETFKDPRHALKTARGIDSVRLKPRKGRTVSIAVAGTKMPVELPPAGTVTVTVGLRDPGGDDGRNRCATAARPFKRSKRGALRYP
jgi:hypothetical protein